MEKQEIFGVKYQDILKKLTNFGKQKMGEGEVFTDSKGYRLLPGLNTESSEYFSEKWDIPENSVFISSFPKTGTAWTNEIVRQILYGRDEKLLQMSKSLPIPLFLIEAGPAMKFKILDEFPLLRKIFPTHLPEELFNFEKMKRKNGKMIYLIRNPKDQAVSLFHFMKKMPIDEITRIKHYGDEWNDFYNKYIQGKQPIGLKEGEMYLDHIIQWMKHKNDENFLIVVYENMKENFPREIRRIAKFLDVELTDDDVTSVADVCSFSSMKKSAENEITGFHKINVRKGEVGGWKERFTVAQSELMDKLVEEKLGNTDIKFKYVL